jgi:hypothetical protein
MHRHNDTSTPWNLPPIVATGMGIAGIPEAEEPPKVDATQVTDEGQDEIADEMTENEGEGVEENRGPD